MRPSVTASLLLAVGLAAAQQKQPWEELPPTPKLPGSPPGALADVNGVKLWHAEFGTPTTDRPPVLLLHGGFGSSDYWGDVVSILMQKHHVLVMDTRGHGRSTMDATPFSYELYAADAAGLLETLGLARAAWVGWSDMAVGTLAALMDTNNATLVERAFVFGAGHNVNSTNATFADTTIYNVFATRAAREYVALQPNGNLTALVDAVETLEGSQPDWSKEDLAKIKLGSKVTVADAQYEEAIVLSEPALLQSWIAGSERVTLKDVSHFAPVQDPQQFAAAVEAFLVA